MNNISSFSEEEFGTALAAAAYAIALLSEEGSPKNKKENGIKKSTDSIKISRWLSGGKSMKKTTTLQELFKENIQDAKIPSKTPTLKKKPTFSDNYLNDTKIPSFPGTNKPPSIKKVPTFSDKYLNDTGIVEPEKKEVDAADSWERNEMAKIRKWHEKMNMTISEWEDEKKRKARRQKERKERELELRRARLMHEYRFDMIRIENIANGARTVSDERKRKDELKTKEVAKIIRATGKVPHTWFCI